MHENEEQEGWLSPSEVAERIGKSERTVRWYCREGRIPGAMLVLGVVPYYRIPEGFSVLPSGRRAGNPGGKRR